MVIASVMLALLVQAGMPDSVKVTGEPSPAMLFGGRTLFIAHLKGPQGVDSAHVIPGDLLGTVEPRPVPLSARHQRELDSARALYERRDYAGAAAILAPAYGTNATIPSSPMSTPARCSGSTIAGTSRSTRTAA